jgi:hypothetical protein
MCRTAQAGDPAGEQHLLAYKKEVKTVTTLQIECHKIVELWR